MQRDHELYGPELRDPGTLRCPALTHVWDYLAGCLLSFLHLMFKRDRERPLKVCEHPLGLLSKLTSDSTLISAGPCSGELIHSKFMEVKTRICWQSAMKKTGERILERIFLCLCQSQNSGLN